MTTLQAIILAIIEGITEFLPVSSTGHMIIGSSLMGIAEQPLTKTFTVAIQFGAILSVVMLYWKRFFNINFQFYKRLLIAFIPAAILGKLLNDYIDMLLENVLVVAVMLLVGGVIFLLLDKWFAKAEENGSDNLQSDKSAFLIGLFQCIAMIPGVSRSAATIIGGLTQKLNKKGAAEFSFFLAVPTMFAATVYKMYELYKLEGAFSSEEIKLIAIGNIVAFIVAAIAIKSFISYLTKHGFKIFGWYRIIVGALIIILYLAGIELKMI
ncbi:MAG TPA: undecaprenyl-diphosphate phosphatase [Bacteroidia bacterium]|nr:MAG: undecaprenyl-diphosphatase UppP [Bacteroidetes bacterium OLB10]MBE7508682.1 undecaprenyl-diphosphate phosphatase [Bacteroidia bacterium]MBX3107277.1 undecaprenyl-diphosphate phosphatase [Bacteroidota bacterium]MCE7955363.1 undecaprenyl-diphosphate phosphatase [Bacteroidetes bacterium CHB6]OQB63478.1 MAG: Undecaprenyl-diphosphatase [Bacteroidetes bacterium ADurb.Bin141]